MPVIDIVRETSITQSPRVMQLQGMFDLPEQETSIEKWSVDLNLDFDWNVGVIVGPSGCGKSTIAGELFEDWIAGGYEWQHDNALVDDFPAEMSIKDITKLLSSVGFSSPPGWLKPYHVLSTGEKFRVDVARALATQTEHCLIDEFTSVVDRTVAQIGSAAIAKTVRKRGQKFIAVTCHYDVLEWLEPDWVYEPHKSRLARDRLHRPRLELEIRRVGHEIWGLFRKHHYLSHTLNKSSKVFAAFYRGQPVAMVAILPQPHRIPLWRVHRAVCLPDYQGVGIGNALNEYICSLFATTKKTTIATSHPAMTHYLARSQKWDMTRKPGRLAVHRSGSNTVSSKNLRKGLIKTGSHRRQTATFQYVGPVNLDDAKSFGIYK